MNTLGIIGGMSPESTAVYYTQINRLINQQRGNNASAPLILYSVEFQEIVDCQKNGDWEKAGKILSQSAKILQNAGAQAVLLATNTMHKVAAPIEAELNIPFLHILTGVAQHIKTQRIHKVGLLGTRGIEAIVPDVPTQMEIHRIIFDELCIGKLTQTSKQFYLRAMNNLAQQGAQGMILGCTEIGLLVQQQDTPIPLFDSTQIHVQMAVEFISGSLKTQN